MPVANPDTDTMALVEDVAGQGSLDDLIPALAKNPRILSRIEQHVQQLQTRHELILGDARRLGERTDHDAGSAIPRVHLVVTSPPYWTLKRYNDHRDQLGHVDDYSEFLDQLDKVWRNCYRILVPGGRLICVVGRLLVSSQEQRTTHRRSTARRHSGAMPDNRI